MLKFAKNEATRKLLNRRVANNTLFKIYPNIYTTDLTTVNEQIHSNISDILGFLNLEGIISYDSSTNISEANTIWIASNSRAKNITIGDIMIRIFQGNETENNTTNTVALSNDEKLRINDPYRMVLQNFSTRKVDIKKINPPKALSDFIKHMNETYNLQTEQYKANLIIVGKSLGYNKEAEKIINILNHQNKTIKNADTNRLYLFEKLSNYINLHEFQYQNTLQKANKKNIEQIAFFESYFSNYIEGTKFEIEEAINIVFDPNHKYNRHKDGNDIIATYNTIKHNILNPININSSEDLIYAIKQWHTNLFNHRKDDIIVGDFKEKPNKAGNTRFVSPAQVLDTLKEGFEYSKNIKTAIGKAMFFKILISEIHPFEDGNGRISRIVMNNFLSLNQQNRIIIPNVFKDDYITALKSFSHNKDVVPFTTALNKASLISQSIPWDNSVDYLQEYLRDKSAYCEPYESMWGIKPQLNIQDSQLDLFTHKVKM